MQPGDRSDQYTIQRLLGSGGMADVYLAWDDENRLYVALKLIHAKAMGSNTLRERFRREVAVAQQLHNPYLVRVFGSGTAPDGRSYLVMEYVDGGSLADLIEYRRAEGSAMPTERAVSLMRRVAAAVGYAHRKGVIHRDLKPANVMIRGSGGDPVVTDLGIASIAGANPLTGTLETVGTPQYMAPEQASGTQAVEERADVYAMGVMLYEMLAGERPFDADNVLAILNLKLNHDPPPLRQLRPDVDKRLAAVVARAMERDPTQRYQSAAEMAAALDAFLPDFASEADNIPSPAPDPPATIGNQDPDSTFWPLPAVRPTWLVMVAISVVIVLVAVAALRLPAPQIAVTQAIAGVATDEETPRPTIKATRTATETPARTALPTSTLSVASSSSGNIDQPTVAVTVSSTTTTDAFAMAFAATITATVRPQSIGGEVRAQVISAETPATVSNGSQTNLTNHAATDFGPMWSPDGARVAFTSDRDGNLNVYVMNADGSGQTNLTNIAAADYGPQWSPDGTKIAFGSRRDGNDEIYVMNADGSGQTNLTNIAAADYGPQWSPDGTKIAFGSRRDGNNEIYVMNADGSGQTRLTTDSGADTTPAWSPDGTQIAFGSGRDGAFEIYVMNADGSGQTNLTNRAGSDTSFDWSPDGTQIIFVSQRDGDNEIYLMYAHGTGQINLTDNAASDDGPQWSPNGTKIAFGSRRDGNREIYVMNADGSGQTNLTNNAASDHGPQWSPDGTRIAFTSYRDGNAEIYVINTNGREETVTYTLPTPVATVFPTTVPLPRPGLLAMTACDGANIERFAANATIPFRWNWAGQLPAGAYLEIRAGISELATLGRVPDSSPLTNGNWEYQVSGGALTEGPGDYRWQVVVMPADGGEALTHSAAGCFAIFGVGSGNDQPSSATDTPQPVATPVPNETDTPVPPATNTPQPPATNTPEPGIDD